MGAEKMASKTSGGSFFHLFDWNRKSRKKLFSNDNASSVGKMEEQKHSSNSSLHAVDEDNMMVVARANEGSNYSCASPTTDEEGHGVRAPGVIAKLMGLDSLPTSGVAEPCSTPLHNARSLCDGYRSPEGYRKDQPSYLFLKGDIYSSRQAELRTHKMPSSPVERFQTETMPLKLTKPVPFTHHKLLSPIKNPGFISPKNASHIIEAATKIFEPDSLNGDRARSQSFRSSLNPSRVHDSREIISAHKRTPRAPDSFPGTTGTLESHKEQTSTSNSNRLEDSMLDQPFPRTKGSSSSKEKVKSVSLAVQGKVNSQRTDQLSRKSGGIQVFKSSEVTNLNKPSKKQLNIQKNNQNKSASSASSSSILRQNNQKQNNLPSKSKEASKPPLSNQQGRKNTSLDTSGKKKTVDNFPGNGKSSYLNEDPEASSRKMEGLSSSSKNLPQRRLLERGTYSQRSGSIDDVRLSGQGKLVRHNVVMDNSAQRKDGTRNGTDVVSFTFTSPMRKSVPALESDDNNSSLDGDSLGVLIERKLKELALRTASPSVRGASVVSAPALDDSTSHYAPTINSEYNNKLILSSNKELGDNADSSFSLNDNQLFFKRNDVQESNVMENFTSILDLKEADHQGQSPLSIFQRSHADEEIYSPRRWKNDGSYLECSSVTSEEIARWDTANKMPMESEMEFSDTVSASSIHTANDVLAAEINQEYYPTSCRQEVDYVKEILSNMGIIFEDMLCLPIDNFSRVLDPIIFDKLEESRGRNAIEGEEKELRLRRKILFDSVNECLDKKCNIYFQAGYLVWAKGVAVAGKELAEELYKEISGWKSIGDWLVDELVDKDMSTHLGRWTNFENESFEAGIDIEKMVLNALVEEVVADFL